MKQLSMINIFEYKLRFEDLSCFFSVLLPKLQFTRLMKLNT